MSTQTPYLRIPANQFFPIFKAGNQDIVLTVEFKNLNQNRVKFNAELSDGTGKVIGLPIKTEVPENNSYKKFNVVVKANTTLQVSTSQPGFAVRAYKPALYAKPGQLHIGNSESITVELNLDADGVHTVVAKGLPQGVTISPASDTIQQGMPVTFTITRDAVSRVVGAAFFQIATLGIGTAIDIMVEEPIPDDGNANGSGDNDPDIDPDLVSAYIHGRDSVS